MADRLRIGVCLSLTGRFAQFGRQAALGLEALRSLDGTAVVIVEDDRSDQQTLEAVLPSVAARCDLLLGPYSTILMRAAGRIAADSGRLIWNHGGSGDDVERAHPGHVVSVLTPTSRYAEPFLRYIAAGDQGPRDLYIVQGPGSFGRQVAEGAAMMAQRLGVRVVRAEPGDFPPSGLPREWDLFSAGVFEQDAELVAKSLRLPNPPRRVCTVAAGVREFAQAVDDPDGVFGIAQWFPGGGHEVLLGPREEDFLRACAASGSGAPDYPAAQAAAGAVIAANCARLAGCTDRGDLWEAAADLETSTLFGGFKIDPQTGAQVSHRTVLLRWIEGKLVPVSTPLGSGVHRARR
jgi:ABC-type branched-subunit amino acid transport system substrate-binding protein